MSDCRKTHSKEHCPDYTKTLDNGLKVPPRENYRVNDRAQQRIFELERVPQFPPEWHEHELGL